MDENQDSPAMEISEDASVNDDDDEDDDSKSATSTNMNNEDEDEETKSVGTSNDADEEDEEEEEEETKSTSVNNENDNETAASASPTPETPVSVAATPSKKKRGKPQIPASARKGRAPAVKGLNIPFRTVKKAMKLDPDIPIVQNEAAIMTTLAAELFLKRLANQSQIICKNRGKNTIRYEDVADARSNDPALAFLKTIIP